MFYESNIEKRYGPWRDQWAWMKIGFRGWCWWCFREFYGRRSRFQGSGSKFAGLRRLGRRCCRSWLWRWNGRRLCSFSFQCRYRAIDSDGRNLGRNSCNRDSEMYAKVWRHCKFRRTLACLYERFRQQNSFIKSLYSIFCQCSF